MLSFDPDVQALVKPDLLNRNQLQDGASSGGAVINSVDNSTPQDSVGDSPSSTAKLSRMAVLMSRSVWDKSSQGQSFPLRLYSPIANQLNKLTYQLLSVFALRTLRLGVVQAFPTSSLVLDLVVGDLYHGKMSLPVGLSSSLRHVTLTILSSATNH